MFIFLRNSIKTYYTGVTSNLEQRVFQQIGFITLLHYERRPIGGYFLLWVYRYNLAIDTEKKKIKNGLKPKRSVNK
jgi:putative endonuclease